MDYWSEREEALMRRHDEILKRRDELLRQSVHDSVHVRHDPDESDFQQLTQQEHYWFAKKQRNEQLLEKITTLVDDLSREDRSMKDAETVAATKLKICKEQYWAYVASCYPAWIQKVEESSATEKETDKPSKS